MVTIYKKKHEPILEIHDSSVLLQAPYPVVFRLEVGWHNSQAGRHIWSRSLKGNKLSQDTVVNHYK